MTRRDKKHQPQSQMLDFWQLHKEQAKHQYKIQRGIPPNLPDVFATGQALLPSCMPLQHVVNSIQNAASGANRWQQPEGKPPFYTGTSESGSTIVEYHDEDTAIESWLQQVEDFTDLDADVLVATLNQLLSMPIENDRRSAWIFASQILDHRGIEPIMKADTPGGPKRRAGHRQEDINDIAQCMRRICNLWVTVNQVIKEDEKPIKGRRKKRRTEYTERSRVLTLESMWYQRELTDDTNEPFPIKPSYQMPIGWEVRAGKWLEPFLQNRQTAWICKQVLEYDPHNELWEKRLARYFFFYFRMNRRTGAFNREIGKMLETLSLPVDTRYPERMRQRFEKAMNRLKVDRQIDDWEYTETVAYPSKGWLPTWLQQKIRIHIAPYQPIKAPDSQEKQG